MTNVKRSTSMEGIRPGLFAKIRKTGYVGVIKNVEGTRIRLHVKEYQGEVTGWWERRELQILW